MAIVAKLAGHSNGVWSVAYSPDGKTLATGSDDKTARLWDAREGKCLSTLTGHPAQVTSVAFSPDGKTLATAVWDSTARLWDVKEGKCIFTLGGVFTGHAKGVYSVAFSPDGMTLATGSEDRTVRLWDVAKGKCLSTLTGHTGYVRSVAFSPDGKTLATGSADTKARLWDVKEGKCLSTLTEHSNCVCSVAFSPDGSTLATGSYDNTVRLWDMQGGKCLPTLTGHSNCVCSVAYSPDGKTLATGSADNTVRLWNAKEGKCLFTLTGHTQSIRSVAFSPDGTTLATGSSDNTARLWDVNDVVNAVEREETVERLKREKELALRLKRERADAERPKQAAVVPPREGDTVRSTSGASYSVVAFLGGGAFGRVYKVATVGDGVIGEHALKWQGSVGDEALATKEAQLHRQLKHRCVVCCIDAWGDGAGAVFALLELCTGGSLRDLVGKAVELRDGGHGNVFLESALPNGRDHFLLVLCDMVDALAYCGRMGVVHCDIKPDNILVDERLDKMVFKLADFGLASVMSRAGDYAKTEGARGTLPYMAPEVYAAWEAGETAQLSAWTDAYSLGLTMLEALRLFTRPVLGGKEDVRRFHEGKKNVEIDNDEHPNAMVLVVLRAMLCHSTAARLTAQGVMEMLSHANVFEVSTTQTVSALQSRLKSTLSALPFHGRASSPLSPPHSSTSPAPLSVRRSSKTMTLAELEREVGKRFELTPGTAEWAELSSEFAKIRTAYGKFAGLAQLQTKGIPADIDEGIAAVIREYL